MYETSYSLFIPPTKILPNILTAYNKSFMKLYLIIGRLKYCNDHLFDFSKDNFVILPKSILIELDALKFSVNMIWDELILQKKLIIRDLKLNYKLLAIRNRRCTFSLLT